MTASRNDGCDAPAPSEPEPAALARLARLLDHVGYDASSIRALAGGAPEIGASERSVVRRRMHGDLAAAVRLFLLGDHHLQELQHTLQPTR